MILLTEMEEIVNIEPTAIALGNFDGVHRGHQKIIGKTIEEAERRGIRSAVFTFSNHPRDFIPGGNPVKNILYRHEKAEVIESLGVDYMFSVPFTKEIMTMEPEAFVKKLLIDRFNAKSVVCGFNYNFGYKAGGDGDLLCKLGSKNGFDVTVVDPYIIDGNVVSSTFIRNLISDGKMMECAKYMGRNYAMSGEVVVGNRIGRKIGFPTSNIVIDSGMVTPPNGVYVTVCEYGGKEYCSITNVGVKPTIGLYKKNVETHIFNFDGELYGKQIKVEFIKKLRDERKFDSVETLSEQIKKDCKEAEEFHKERCQ